MQCENAGFSTSISCLDQGLSWKVIGTPESLSLLVFLLVFEGLRYRMRAR
jgi:hypothetical protein